MGDFAGGIFAERIQALDCFAPPRIIKEERNKDNYWAPLSGRKRFTIGMIRVASDIDARRIALQGAVKLAVIFLACANPAGHVRYPPFEEALK